MHHNNDSTDHFYKAPSVNVAPDVFEETFTTTMTTTLNKELNSIIDEMTTTHLERSPIRRVNLVGGPRSAFARLFPDKYRQEQEEASRTHRSKSSDDRRYNFNRIDHPPRCSDEDLTIDTRRKSHRVSFDETAANDLKTRTKSDPYLHEYINIPSATTTNADLSHMPLNYDPDPEIIYRDNPDKVVYVQKVGVRYLKPPTPPAPGPLVIREVQATPHKQPPPLVVSNTPPSVPRTPSPFIVREQPPSPPLHQPTRVITKTLPAGPAPARRVIIKRIPPLPAKPRPVIIEKWLPYKDPPERPVLYERAEQAEPTRPAQRNVILQYEPARVRIEQEFQNVGCFRVDPEIYRAQFGTSLRRTDSIRKVLEQIGCNPDLITSTGYNTCYPSNHQASSSVQPEYAQRRTTTCFTDEQLSELITSSPSSYRPQTLS